VVANDVEAGGKSLVMVTGANQGGKSTFLRSVGLAQLMAQCGMFVAADAYLANACSGVFTHYKREEDETMESGKLDEELARMSDIADQIHGGCLLLCNESFAATNEREGSQIARQVIDAMLAENIKVVFVTHLFDLAASYHEQRMGAALFLRAPRGDDGARPFRLSQGEPLPTSYGEDTYRKIFGATARAAIVSPS
jgi:DNA mismatch repair ATPase MutS